MSKRILLVEDEALIALNEAQMLKKHGYEVVTAYNGEKAVELVNNDPEISLILMDIDLGKGMDGPEAAEKILDQYELPIVFCTSHSEKEYVDRVKKITNYGYVLKNSGEFVLIESINMAYTLFDAHKKLEKENGARRETEEELSSIYTHTPVLIVLVDKERRVRKANAFAAQFAGTPAEELIGKREGEALRCIHHLDDPKGCGFGPFCTECTVKRAVGNTFANKKKYQRVEATLPFLQQGEEQHLTFLVSTSLLHKKEEDLCLVAFEDITDYKQLQEKYKGLFENAPLPYQSLDTHGHVLEINSAWLDALGGYTREEVLGKSFVDFLHPDSMEDFRNNLEKLKKYGTAKDNIYKMKKKNGEYIDASFNGRIAYTSEGKVKQTHCIFKDVTEQRRIKTELRQSEERARAVIETAEDSIFIKDMSGEYTMVNPAMEKLFGRESKDIIGKTDYELFGEEAGKAVNEADKAVYEGKVVEEFPAKPINGALHTFHTIKVPLHDSEGTITGLCGIARDITERKQADELLKKRNATLHEINQYSIELGFLRYDELYPYIIKKLKNIFKTSTAWVTEYDENTSHMVVKSTSLSDKDNSWVMKKLGEKVIGHRAQVNAEHYKMMRNVQAGDPQTLHEVSFGAIPENIAKLIEKGFNIDWFMPVVFINKDKITGAAVIAGKPGEEVPDRELVLAFAGITGEVIERKRAEENLREALKEKDFLMKELNHRVKNSLLMVSSLINLKDSETAADLSEIKHQIGAISLIHEKLYQTESVAEISCRDYFYELLNSIFSSFSIYQVRIEANIDEISIPTKSAMSLGLIINEIATNAIKHGFNEKEEAVFSIKMEKGKEKNRYELTLSNTGNPFPEEIDIAHSDTLGLQLISALTEQLGGAIDLKREPRPVFTIRFPIEDVSPI